MERGIWIANKKREVKAFFTYEEAKARRARMKAGGPIRWMGQARSADLPSFSILTLINIHDTI